MSYRRLDNSSPRRTRTFVDLIPDRNFDIDDDDAQEDDDFIIHPEWKAMVHRLTSRIPRRIKRYAMIYLVLMVVFWVAWRNHLGPRYAQYRQDIQYMDAIPETAYGTQVRPYFKDTIHIKKLDAEHLPVGDKRLVFIGDVHGCVDELKALLQKVKFDKQRDHLVLTGDIVNKGPNSTAVVALAQSLGASCVRGNHEDKLLLTVADMLSSHVPLPGPNEPLGRAPDFLDEESHSQRDYKRRKQAREFTPNQISWLKECPIILRIGNLPGIGDTVVVHAGLVPDISLEQQDPFQVMNMRTIDLKTRVPSEERHWEVWERLWNYRQKKLPSSERMTVIYGHDARRGLNVQKYSKGLDSSCVRGGRLTALVVGAGGKEKYVSVKCKGYVQ